MSKNESCASRICGMALTLGILGASGFGLWWWLGKPDVEDSIRNFDFGDFSDVLGNFTDFVDQWDTDPFVGDNTTSPWGQNEMGVGGLTLELQNACDDSWNDEFAKAVDDWDNGNPDALTLTTSRIAIDRICTHSRGVMKVCNGNYGDTGWLGINEIALDGQGVILSSVAKMNEYYLLNANQDARQYTMCHEIGHGFGLPHTDENFRNADLGNCLDYTNNPANNLLPGEVNFQKLKGMYGEVGATNDAPATQGNNNLRRALSTDLMLTSTVEDSTVRDKRPYSDDENDSMVRAREELLSALSSLRRNLEATEQAAIGSWTVHTMHERGGHFSRKLRNGCEIRMNVLFPLA